MLLNTKINSFSLSPIHLPLFDLALSRSHRERLDVCSACHFTPQPTLSRLSLFALDNSHIGAPAPSLACRLTFDLAELYLTLAITLLLSCAENFEKPENSN
jgi:hypothetical protein